MRHGQQPSRPPSRRAARVSALEPELTLAEALAELKRLLQEATEFGDIATYFFDRVFEIPEFLDAGAPARDSKVEASLTEIGKRFASGPVSVLSAMLIEIPDHSFVHGQCTVGRHMGMVIYFRDIEVGLAVFSPVDMTGDTAFVRFRPVDLIKVPGMPRGVPTLHGGPPMESA